MNASLFSDLAAGRGLPEQYLAVIILAAVALSALYVWSSSERGIK